MTMNIPADHHHPNLSKQHCYAYDGGGFSEGHRLGLMSPVEEGYGCSEFANWLGSDTVVVAAAAPPPPMADQDESGTQSTVNEAPGSNISTSKLDIADHEHQQDIDQDKDEEEGWLQLGISIGGQSHKGTSNNKEPKKDVLVAAEDGSSSRRRRLIELDLLPAAAAGGGSTSTTSSQNEFVPLLQPLQLTPITIPYPTSLMFLQPPPPPNISSSFRPHQEINNNWALFRPIQRNIIAAAASDPSSSSSLGPPPHNFVTHNTTGGAIDFRVVDAPPRPHSGIWFMLQASPIQANEPFLPQISKSFLRIKDGKMRIQLVIKYLVNKLKLESESEIEMRCKGHQILPFVTLQHVRDSIWRSPSDALTLLPANSSATDHIMVLQYGRSP